MPVFLLLQCYACSIFIPQQETKNSKWACRMCSAKQSITKVFAKSENTKELRLAAQQLNARHGETRDNRNMQQSVNASPPCYEYSYQEQEDDYNHHQYHQHTQQHQQQQRYMSGSAEGASSQDASRVPAPAGGAGSRWGAYMVGGGQAEEKASAGLFASDMIGCEDDERFVTELPAPQKRGEGGGSGRREGGGGGGDGEEASEVEEEEDVVVVGVVGSSSMSSGSGGRMMK